MAKIEEITELLVNEINSFKNDVEKLEKINEKLNSTKISIDIKEVKLLLEDHQNKMRNALDSQARIYNRYEKLLKNARIYPNWAVIVFIISLVIGIATMSYVILNRI